MIGLWSAYVHSYLLLLVAVTSLVFALPIFLMPLRWARLFRWRLPEDTDLAVYFGRCLGAFVLVIEALMLRAGLTGEGVLFTCQALLAVALLMVVVHVWGALQRIQPITETLEIGIYAGMFILTLLFYTA